MRTSRRLESLAIFVLVSSYGATAAQAAEGEAARVRFSAALLDETVRGLLPTMIRLPPPSGEPSPDNRPTLATMTELIYCGASEKGVGHFRALLRLESEPAPAALLVGRNGCQGDLADLAKRVGESNEAAGIAVAELDATWRPWEIHFVVARVEGTTKTSKTRLVAVLEKRRELLVVQTGDVRIQAESGPLPLYAVPSFAAAGIEVAIVLGGAGAPSSPEKLAGSPRGPFPNGDSNVSADVPLSFANQLLRRLTWNEPMLVPVNRDEVEIRNVSLSGEGSGERARVTLTGQATPSSIRETVRWTVAAAGDPMRLSSIQIAAQMEDCAGLGTMAAVGCNVRNGARSAAAEGFAGSLTQRYQGRAVHDLGSPQTLRFTVAGERFILSGDLLRMTFGARGISIAARLAVP
jgi:hypothetical protein